MPPPPTETPAGGFTIRLRVDVWHSLRKARGLNVDTIIARRMGVTSRTVARVQNGEVAPSPAFMAGALATLDHPADRVPFGRLFRIEAAS